MPGEDLTSRLKTIVLGNPLLVRVLDALEDMPELRVFDYDVGAGIVNQSVWNALTGRAPGYGVKDVDIVYFDPDLSERKEAEMARRGAAGLAAPESRRQERGVGAFVV